MLGGDENGMAGGADPAAPGLGGDSIPRRFARVVARHGSRIAITSAEAEWTYEELNARSESLARQILEAGGVFGDPVALLLEHGAALIGSILGALQAGRTYLALDPSFPPPRLAAMVADSGARLVLCDPSNLALARALCPENAKVLEVPRETSGPERRAPLPNVSPDAGAWLMYTSGSTAEPKGVWQDHAGVGHHSDLYSEAVQLTPEDRLSLITPLSLAASATHLFAALLHGAALCPFSVRSLGLERLAAWLRERRITLYHSVPTVFRQLTRMAGHGDCFQTLRLVRLGGEPVMRPEAEWFRRHCPSSCRLMHSFSSTETSHITAFMLDPGAPLPPGRLPVGKPVRGVEVSLVDARQRPVAAGEVGRIRVRSAFLARGYWRRPDATRAEFMAEPNGAHARAFLAADLGRWLPDGNLEHLGRADQTVKIVGQSVSLAEVEAALLATDLVAEAAVTAPVDARGAPRLVAYIASGTGKDVSSRELRRRLAGRLPGHMLPHRYVSLNRLPCGPGGKLDRNALPPPPERDLPLRFFRKPRLRGRVEEQIASAWRAVLGVSTIDRQDDFFELGGNSLQSADVLSRIDKIFGTALPPSTLAEHSTVQQLADVLSARFILPSSSPLVTLSTAKQGQPLFLIHTGQGNVVCYALLARRLGQRPILGLQSVGLRGESWPLMSIPAMARRYLPEIQACAPAGPVLLAGTCMGGLVAFELANLLLRAGREVGLLALMDTSYPLGMWKHPCWRERFYGPCRDFVRDGCRILRWRGLRAAGFGQDPRWLPGFRRFIAHMNDRAHRRYRPGFYPGTLTLLLTAEFDSPRMDRRPFMKNCARQVRTITIPGKRADLFNPPAVNVLANHLDLLMKATENGRAQPLAARS